MYTHNPSPINLSKVLMISGIVLVCIGVSIQVKFHDTFLVLNEAAAVVPTIVTVIGTFIILVAVFGAIALLKCNLRMMRLFTGILLALLIAEIEFGTVVCIYREKLHQTLLRDVLRILDKYSRELHITKGVDSLQRQFQCCGAENYTDWLNTTFGFLSSSVPRSCCKVPVESCVTDLSKYTIGINQQGCVLKLKNWVEEHMTVFGGVGIFIGLAQNWCGIEARVLDEDLEDMDSESPTAPKNRSHPLPHRVVVK
ncbi:hypothetical protein JRQ81_001828 [Phrynocephalus forsythii]|uniref:Tetraspanin n=1 Tax=Phrynocephalus forsythii TaxID=171643 RepID=A0A9Q0Y902_9SAUR|nr:hypothetical protein JRQ81_001828 [Phrynocephalus forsythii]